MVSAEIERQWQDILDEVNVDLLTDVKIFSRASSLICFELSLRESSVEGISLQQSIHQER